jgi:hypothetical protein
MRKSFVAFAYVGAAVVQWFLWYRIARVMSIRDYTPPDSWYFQNLALAGLALLLVAPILRHGTMWQRLFAGLLAAYPVVILALYYYYALTELTFRDDVV